MSADLVTDVTDEKRCQCSGLSVPPERTISVDAQGIAISLFSRAGGLDLGAERGRYEVRLQSGGIATLLQRWRNFDHLVLPVIQQDILQRLGQEDSGCRRAAWRSALCPVLQVWALA